MEHFGFLTGFCVVVVFISQCLAGSEPVYLNHRSTSLEELKQIDGLVSSNLPLFNHGFFIQTSNGPVLVKAKEEGAPNPDKPRLNPGYYRTLPRLIPAGYEGVAFSHFNLGSAIPAQATESVIQDDTNYEGDGRQIQYSQSTPYSPYQYSQTAPVAPIQYTQNTDHTPENFENQQSSQSRSQQYIHRGLPREPLVSNHHQPQQILQQFEPQQRQQRFLNQPQRHSPVAQDTFQINNFLSNSDDNSVPTSFQSQVLGGFNPSKFARNPTVEQAFGFDDTLPDHLRNPFYKNQDLASALAQESLPTEGEEVVGEWDTTKIQKKKIQDLLRSAGFI